MKANFIQRAIAYLIDIFLVSFIIVIISSTISLFMGENSTNIIESNNTIIEENSNIISNEKDIQTQYLNKEITSEEFLEEYTNTIYETQKGIGFNSVLNIVMLIAYFVIYQKINKGQTIGKKIMKIRLVDEKRNDLTYAQMIIRGIIIYSLVSGLLNILLLFNISKNIFITLYMTTIIIEFILLLLSALFILYRNDKKALHDIVSKSIVIKEN